MFTLEDIKPLVQVEGARAVLVKIDTNEIDFETRKLISNQIKKATKLPVICIPQGVEIEMITEELINGGEGSGMVSKN